MSGFAIAQFDMIKNFLKLKHHSSKKVLEYLYDNNLGYRQKKIEYDGSCIDYILQFNVISVTICDEEVINILKNIFSEGVTSRKVETLITKSIPGTASNFSTLIEEYVYIPTKKFAKTVDVQEDELIKRARVLQAAENNLKNKEKKRKLEREKAVGKYKYYKKDDHFVILERLGKPGYTKEKIFYPDLGCCETRITKGPGRKGKIVEEKKIKPGTPESLILSKIKGEEALTVTDIESLSVDPYQILGALSLT
ncbi:hypothetical protein OAG24_00695 [bacterium]|nr:hypothetical protein [bacterium]